jgi:hypothetical protein
VPDRVQIDTTLVRQNRVQNHALIRRHRLLNRTAVKCGIDGSSNNAACSLCGSEDATILEAVDVHVSDQFQSSRDLFLCSATIAARRKLGQLPVGERAELPRG